MPNETTRLKRTKESFRGIIPNPRRAAELLQWSAERTEVVELKNEILANSQAVLDLTEQIESLTAQLAELREQVNEWREASKTAVEITHIMEDTRHKLEAQIESLTAALAEALGELQKYQGVFGILPTLEDVENGTTELL